MTMNMLIDTTVVQKMKNLPSRRSEKFDPNIYFSVLTHLSLKPGYTLGSVYDGDRMIHPVFIYARLISDPPLTSFPRLFSSVIIRRKKEHQISEPPIQPPHNREEQRWVSPEFVLIADGTPDSFFQLVLFDEYQDVIVSSADMEQAISVWGRMFSDEKIEAVRKMPISLCVEFADTTVAVTFCRFGIETGFARMKKIYNRNPPHKSCSETLSEVRHGHLIVF